MYIYKYKKFWRDSYGICSEIRRHQINKYFLIELIQTHVYRYIYIYVYIYVFMCIYINVYTYTYIYTFIYICIHR